MPQLSAVVPRPGLAVLDASETRTSAGASAPPPITSTVASPAASDTALDAMVPPAAHMLHATSSPATVEVPAVGRPGTTRPIARATWAASARVALRLDAALEGSREALLARRAVYAETIQRHEATITGLEAELAAIHTRIAHKTGDVRDLLARKQRLTSEIANNRRMATAAGVYGGVLGLFTFGAAAAVGAGVAASAAIAVAKLSSDLSSAERSERDARSTLSDLERASRAFDQARAASAARLGGLRAEHQALTSSAPVVALDAHPRVVVAALEQAVVHDEAIIANLEAQIQALRTARAQATTFEAGLDTLINRLQTEVAALEKQVVESRRALVSTLVDIALAGFGATAILRKAGLPLADKTVLLAGIDMVRGDLASVVSKLVDGLVSSALVAATDSPLLGKVLGAITTAPLTGLDAAERMASLVTAASRPLTAPQRALLERIAA